MDPLSVDQVELGLPEGRRQLVLHHLHPDPVAGALAAVAVLAPGEAGPDGIVGQGWTVIDMPSSAAPGSQLLYKVMGAVPDTQVIVDRQASIQTAVALQAWRGADPVAAHGLRATARRRRLPQAPPGAPAPARGVRCATPRPTWGGDRPTMNHDTPAAADDCSAESRRSRLWTELACSKCGYRQALPGTPQPGDLDEPCALCGAELGAVTVFRLNADVETASAPATREPIAPPEGGS
jgi:hypothetical protein